MTIRRVMTNYQDITALGVVRRLDVLFGEIQRRES